MILTYITADTEIAPAGYRLPREVMVACDP
ncbi:MAG: hypothetical protein JWP43_260 [Ramlibacter sp.]|nr:hypothetical protein [Ramlibacter sp.]